MSDPISFFRGVAAEHPRCFWLDGGGAREWSGQRSLIGWLDDDDVSLSWSASRREVTRHTAGGSEVVGDDVFAALEAALRPGEQWFGYLGAAARTDLPATPDPVLPDAVWMRPSAVRVFDHAPVHPEASRLAREVRSSPMSTPPPSPPSRSTCTPATPTRST